MVITNNSLRGAPKQLAHIWNNTIALFKNLANFLSIPVPKKKTLSSLGGWDMKEWAFL